MPSLSFSTAMESSLCIQRKVFRCRWSFVAYEAMAVSMRRRRVASPGVYSHVLQEVGADCEQVAAGQADDLIHLSEAGSHHLGPVVELLEVVVDTRDRGDAR